MRYKMKSIEERIINDYSTFKAPGAPLRNFNDGGGRGSDRGSYFIPKISQLQKLSTQKITTFFSIPKKIS